MCMPLEEENKKLKERIKLALEGYKAGLYEWNMVDNSAYYSDEWKQMLGLQDEDIKPHLSSWSQRVHPDDLWRVMQDVDKTVAKKEKDIEAIHRLKHKNGEWLWILGRGRIEYDANGTPIKMVGIHTDITQQKLNELTLKHQAQIIEQTHDSIITTDNEGYITSWNKGAQKLFGYTPNEIIDQHITLLQYEPDVEEYNRIANYIQSHHELHTETYLKTKTGKKIFVNLSLSSFLDENEILKGIIINAQDITHNKEMELQLEQSNYNMRQYLNAVDEIGIGLFVVNKEFKVQYMNHTMQKWFGYNLGKTCYSSVAQLESPCPYCKLHDVVEENKKVVYTPTTPDGRTFEIVATSIKNRDGTRSKMEVIRDISDEMRAKNILLKEKQELQYKANHDLLTELPNRFLFQDRLQHSIEKAKRNKTKIALFFIDLDHFKEINDSLGHHIGDQVLKESAQRIKRSVRAEDTLARIGGDEFTLIIEDLLDPNELESFAGKILHQLIQPITINDFSVTISCSIGISIFPDDADNDFELLQCADSAMYKAKESGRNRFSFFKDIENKNRFF